MENSIEIPLDLPDVRVQTVDKTTKGEWLIRLESRLKGTTCHQCGRQIDQFHGFDSALRLRHLPLFEVPVFIELRPKRYRCQFCEGKPTTTQSLSWHTPRSPNTKPYERWLLRMMINSTVVDVAKKLAIKAGIVTGVLDRWLAKQVNWDAFERLETIGIDEIALQRGHRDYVVLVTTPLTTGVEVLAVLADRQKQTVCDFFAAIPMRIKTTIERVYSDMYQGFIGAAQAQLPWAKIVIDRFHVAKAYRDCADTVRKQEVKRLKKTLSQADYAAIKGAMWPFRKLPEDLKERERALLERLFEHSPKLQQAYSFRKALTQIFSKAYTKPGSKCAIRAWCKRVRKSEIAAFDSFLVTVEARLDIITNYFIERLTSGFVEGFNNKVKVLKRRCYGIFNLDQLFQRLTLDTRGFQLFGFP